MGEVHSSQEDPLTTTLARRLEELWDAYGRGDVDGHNAILTPDYEAVHPDGSCHPPPTAAQIAAEPMGSYRLNDLRVWLLAPGVALTRYVAEVSGEREGQHVTVQFVVAAIWLEQDGTWRCRHYQPTVLGAGRP